MKKRKKSPQPIQGSPALFKPKLPKEGEITKEYILKNYRRWYDYSQLPFAEKVFISHIEEGLIPEYITTVLDLGCAAGRNLMAFNGKYQLIGIDLPKTEEMSFPPEIRNFQYIKHDLNEPLPDMDLTTTLCISHGVINYLPPNKQVALQKRLVELGCCNFLLQEYDDTLTNYAGPYWPFENVLGLSKTICHPKRAIHTWKKFTYAKPGIS